MNDIDKMMHDMPLFLERERELRRDGMVANEIMGDYSVSIFKARISQGCFCGDCAHFAPEIKNADRYSLVGSCRKGYDALPADTGHNCLSFVLRTKKYGHARKRNKKR